MQNTKISVVVPAYNIEKYLERCIESILCQSHRELEIIIVDDGSSDGTPQIVDGLCKRDERVAVIHKENGGVTSARFAGMKAATGDWIGFIDGDDVIEPDMYERLLSNADKYGADISHCGYQMIFPSRVDYYYNTGKLVVQDKKRGLKDLLESAFVEPGLCNKLFRANIVRDFLKSGEMDMSIKINEDLLMNFYLFSRAEKSVFEDVCPYHYMVQGQSAAVGAPNEHKLYDVLKVTEILTEKTRGSEELQGILARKYLRQQISAASMRIWNEKDRPLVEPYRKKAAKWLRSNIFGILFGKRYGIKMKLMALCTAISPSLYGFIHWKYAHKKGNDRKYSVS